MSSPARDGEQPPLDVVDSPGKRLRIARQAKGLSQSDVAAHLHLSSAIIDALEQDEHDSLPGPVFVRGYMRNYARLLRLDENSLSLSSSESPGDGLRTPPKSYGAVKPEIRSSHLAVRLVTWVLVLGLIALLAVWWQGRLDWNGGVSYEPSAPAPETALEPGLLPPLPATPPVEEAGGVDEDPTPAAEPDPAMQTDEAETKPAEEAAAVVRPVPPELEAASREVQEVAEEEAQTTDAEREIVEADQPRVVFEFLGPCWVDIRDATRKFKVFGEMRKGDRRELQGTPPYSVILGNSPMVRATVDGQAYDIEAHARGSVARFTLDPKASAASGG